MSGAVSYSIRKRLYVALILLGLLVAIIGCSRSNTTSTPTLWSNATPAPTVGSNPTLTPTPTPTLAISTPTVASTTRVSTYKLVNSYPHDPSAFTQGLVFEEGFIYEGTGVKGQSTLRKVDLQTGDVLLIHELPKKYFGEGITIYGDRIIQLTWRSNIGFVYDKESFRQIDEFSYPTEGWGITHDGDRLILSDGTATLYFMDPDSFEITGQIDVRDDDGPVALLNELEYILGEVYANVWQTDTIVRIDPQTGRVIGWIDLAGLLDSEESEEPVDVLNGIAYDPSDDRLFVTGKLWPSLFEIDVVPGN